MYAVYQVNRSVLGVGATVQAAINDANRWTSETFTLQHLDREQFDGAVIAIECSKVLYHRVLVDGNINRCYIDNGRLYHEDERDSD